MLDRTLEQAAIPEIFAHFSQVIGEGTWLERAAELQAEMEAKPFLRDYLMEQNRIVLDLCECTLASRNNRGVLPYSITALSSRLQTFVFVWRVVQLAEAARRLTKKRFSIFVKRVREALRSPTTMGAMQMEATLATHFVSLGHRVVFPELGSSSERFDLLVEDLGPSGLEIECKVVTVDKGRKIHKSESRELLPLLAAIPCVHQAASRSCGGLAIRITVPVRLPQPEKWSELCREVSLAILAGGSIPSADGTEISLFDFDPSILGKLTNPPSPETMMAIESITGTRNRHSIIFRPQGHLGGLVVIVLGSRQADSMLHELFQTFADAAGRQLTGRRPGALFAIFEGVGLQHDDLGRTNDGAPSALAWKASEFLELTPLPHVVGVGFLSEPDYSSAEAASGGSTFWIPKKVSPFWHPSLSGIFGADPRAILAT